jgi:hypothetical protein
VDNGPADLISGGNNRLYDRAGLEVIRAALRPGGILAVWSAGPDQAFAQRLRRADFGVEEVRAQGHQGGRRHTICWPRCTTGDHAAAGATEKKGGPRKDPHLDILSMPVR